MYNKKIGKEWNGIYKQFHCSAAQAKIGLQKAEAFEVTF